MSEINIATSRFETKRQLDDLEQARGAAILDNRAFDEDALAELQQKLAGLTAAEGEQVRRQRVDAATERKNRREKLAVELLELEVRRLDAISDTEKGARQLVAALTRITDISKSMQKTCAKADFKVPLGLNEYGTASRISTYLGAVLTRLAGPGNRYGALRWFYSGRHKANVDFSAQEETLMFNQLQDVLKGIDYGTNVN